MSGNGEEDGALHKNVPVGFAFDDEAEHNKEECRPPPQQTEKIEEAKEEEQRGGILAHNSPLLRPKKLKKSSSRRRKQSVPTPKLSRSCPTSSSSSPSASSEQLGNVDLVEPPQPDQQQQKQETEYTWNEKEDGTKDVVDTPKNNEENKATHEEKKDEKGGTITHHKTKEEEKEEKEERKAKAFDQLARKLLRELTSGNLERLAIEEQVKAFLLAQTLLQTDKNDLCQLWMERYKGLCKAQRSLGASFSASLSSSSSSVSSLVPGGSTSSSEATSTVFAGLFFFLKTWGECYYGGLIPSQKKQLKQFIRSQMEAKKPELDPQSLNLFKLLLLRAERRRRHHQLRPTFQTRPRSASSSSSYSKFNEDSSSEEDEDHDDTTTEASSCSNSTSSFPSVSPRPNSATSSSTFATETSFEDDKEVSLLRLSATFERDELVSSSKTFDIIGFGGSKASHRKSFMDWQRPDLSVAELRNIHFINIPSLVFAKGLQALDFKLFKRIKAEDWVQLGLSSEQPPSVRRLTRQFNKLSYWIVSKIVRTKQQDNRVKILTKTLRVARECQKLRNWNSLMAIFAGLNHHAVKRLSNTWEQLPPAYVKEWESLEELLGPKDNFKNYREAIRSSSSGYIPYIGIVAKDLMFMHEGNKRYLDDGSINMELLQLLYERLDPIFQAQCSLFPTSSSYPSVDAYIRCIQPLWDEDKLYALSLKAQPSLWRTQPRTKKVKANTDSDDVTSSENSVSDTAPRDEAAITPKEAEAEAEEEEEVDDKPEDKANQKDSPPEQIPNPEKDNEATKQKERKCRAIIVSQEKRQLFMEIEEEVERCFGQLCQLPKTGELSLFGQRFLLLNAKALSVGFITSIRQQILLLPFRIGAMEQPNVTYDLLYELGFLMGHSECQLFRKNCSYSQPHQKEKLLAAGLVASAFKGNCLSELVHKAPHPTPETFHLEIKAHSTFEASSWLHDTTEQRPDRCVCMMHSGHLGGWASASYDMDLVCVEVECVSQGANQCSFLVSHSSMIEHIVGQYCSEHGLSTEQRNKIHITRCGDCKKKLTSPPEKQLKEKRSSSRRLSFLLTKSGASRPWSSTANLTAAMSQSMSSSATPTTVAGLAQLAQLSRRFYSFLSLQQDFDPSEGSITLAGERYTLLLAQSLTAELSNLLSSVVPSEPNTNGVESQLKRPIIPSLAAHLMYNLGRALGKADICLSSHANLHKAALVQKVMSLQTVAGHLGWGKLDVDLQASVLEPESKSKVPFLVKFQLKRSVEAESYRHYFGTDGKEEHGPHRSIAAELRHQVAPLCVVCAGYASGYLQKCFREVATAKVGVVEIACGALGQDSSSGCCEFVAGPAGNLRSIVEEHLRKNSGGSATTPLENLRFTLPLGASALKKRKSWK